MSRCLFPSTILGLGAIDIACTLRVLHLVSQDTLCQLGYLEILGTFCIPRLFLVRPSDLEDLLVDIAIVSTILYRVRASLLVFVHVLAIVGI